MGFDEIYNYEIKKISIMTEILNSIESEIENIKVSMEKISLSWCSQAGDRNVLLKRMGNVRKETGKNIAKLRGFCASAIYYLSQMKKFDKYDGRTFSGRCKVSDVSYSKSNSMTIKCKPEELRECVIIINKSATSLMEGASDLNTLINALNSYIANSIGTGKRKLSMYRKNIGYQADILKGVAVHLGQMATNYINAETKIKSVIADLKKGDISVSQLEQMVNEQVKQEIGNNCYTSDKEDGLMDIIDDNVGRVDDLWGYIEVFRDEYLKDISLGKIGDKLGILSTITGYLSKINNTVKGLDDGCQVEDANNILDLLSGIAGDLIKTPSGTASIYKKILLSYGCNILKNVNEGISQKLPVEDIIFRAGGISLVETYENVVTSDINMKIAYYPAMAISNLFGYDLGQEAMRVTGCDDPFKAVTSAPKQLIAEIKKNATWDNWKSGFKIMTEKLKFW